MFSLTVICIGIPGLPLAKDKKYRYEGKNFDELLISIIRKRKLLTKNNEQRRIQRSKSFNELTWLCFFAVVSVIVAVYSMMSENSHHRRKYTYCINLFCAQEYVLSPKIENFRPRTVSH